MTSTAVPAVRLNPPPPALMRRINPLVRWVLRSRSLGGRVDRIALLEFTGRRTGRPYCVPAGLHVVDGVPVVFTSRPWRWNFAGGAPVTVVHRGRPRAGQGLLLDPDPQRLGAALRRALDDGASPFDLGLRVTRSCEPTADDLGRVGLSVIRLDLDPIAG